MTFEELDLIPPILKALRDEGYTRPTPIQEQAIPLALDRKDILASAQTGTGKTAAFALPILQILYNKKKSKKGPGKIASLILTPTRELAVQIDESFRAYGKYTGLKTLSVYGGVAQKKQTNALRTGVDILVATPGRLMDLMQQGFIDLRSIEIFVLDEADRMLDMGFIDDIKKIIKKLPEERQTLFFSATLPTEIRKLSKSILVNPERIDIKPTELTVDKIRQEVYFISKKDKPALLFHLLKERDVTTALVFTRTKRMADKLNDLLRKERVKAQAIHGDKSQSARQKALNSFKQGRIKVLVATDVAARGIDIEELSHVINFDMPESPETYVHRIGRTGRAGAEGVAVSFCDSTEKKQLLDIQKLIGRPLPVIENHPFPLPKRTLRKRSRLETPEDKRMRTRGSRVRKRASKKYTRGN